MSKVKTNGNVVSVDTFVTVAMLHRNCRACRQAVTKVPSCCSPLPLRYIAVASPDPVAPAAATPAAAAAAGCPGGGARAAGRAAAPAAAVLLLLLPPFAGLGVAAAAAAFGGGGGDSSFPFEASGITGASAAKKSSSEITGGGGGAGGLGRIAGPPRPGVPLLLRPARALSEFKLPLLPPAAEGPLGGRPLLLLLLPAAAALLPGDWEGLARKERSYSASMLLEAAPDSSLDLQANKGALSAKKERLCSVNLGGCSSKLIA
jgi:hypothetical protein